MTLFYRVENADKNGMYTTITGTEKTRWEMQDEMRHPAPRYDSALCKAVGVKVGSWDVWDTFNYGFISLEQLKSWIYKMEWRKEIFANDFSISVYEVEEVFAGDTQAVIKIGCEKKLIETLDITKV